jgi:hypothetical protein
MLLGVVVLVALLAAYLSDCLPGLGSGGELGTPSSEAPAAPPSPHKAAGEASASSLTLVVQGEQCRRGQAQPEPCAQLCASLDRTGAAATEIILDATEGRHGTVEELRTCLQEAGFARVRVLSE